MPMINRLRRAFLAAAFALVALPAAAQENGLVTRQSAHSVSETIARFDAHRRDPLASLNVASPPPRPRMSAR